MQIHEQRIAMGTTNKANGAQVFIFFYALLVCVRNNYFHRYDVILKETYP